MPGTGRRPEEANIELRLTHAGRGCYLTRCTGELVGAGWYVGGRDGENGGCGAADSVRAELVEQIGRIEGGLPERARDSHAEIVRITARRKRIVGTVPGLKDTRT